MKGHEFDASFANAKSISKFNGEKYATVDDIAAAGHGLPALITLMYAPVPLQKCLSVGYRMEGKKWQCSLDNLREILQGYPTFLQTLELASYGHDAWGFYAIRSTNAGEWFHSLPSITVLKGNVHCIRLGRLMVFFLCVIKCCRWISGMILNSSPISYMYDLIIRLLSIMLIYSNSDDIFCMYVHDFCCRGNAPRHVRLSAMARNSFLISFWGCSSSSYTPSLDTQKRSQAP